MSSIQWQKNFLWIPGQYINISMKVERKTQKTEEECMTQRQTDNGNKTGGCKVSM